MALSVMSWINRLEPNLGRFAIPGLLRIVAGFQGLTFLLLYFDRTFLDFLLLDMGAVFAGEVWRLASWVIIPRSLSIIFIVFALWFLVFVGDGLERAWGAFRLNVYVFSGVVLVDLAALYLYHAYGADFAAGFSPFFSAILFASVILAFAVNFPDVEIRLMLFIPMKMKWVGAITAGYVIFEFLRFPPLRLPIFIGMLNFFLYAVPIAVAHYKQRVKATARKAKFDRAQLPASDAFHRCERCGKTDREDPNAEFRVASDGSEFCMSCLKEITQENSPAKSP